MKIMVFGATGGTGQQVVAQALRAGHHVTAVVRQPARFLLHHPQLTVLQGDVLQPSSFTPALVGQDAVISCLGTRQRGPTTVYSEGMKAIGQAMAQAGARRVVCLSAGAVVVPAKASWLIKLLTKQVLQRVFKYLYADMRAMEELLLHSALDWTVVRPPWLRDTPLTGHYQVAINAPLAQPSKLARADLAHYLVHCLPDAHTFRQVVELSY